MTDHPRLIGLYSPAPQSGKSSVASYLSCHGYRVLPFAGPLKRMIATFLHTLGCDAATIERLMTTDKELPIPEIGVSARHLCQTLGTEWGRACVHPEIWIKAWQLTAQRDLDRGIDIVVDDVRFPNEARTIRELGGELWRVERPGLMRTTTHASEGGLDHFDFDREFTNDCTLFALYQQVREIVSPACAA
jgi:hypothetical protein